MNFKDGKTLFLIIFCSTVLVVSATAFVYKLTEFSMTVVRDGLEGFGIVAISVYLVGLVGLLMWNMWAYSKGYFRNIEQPKFRMLEMEAEYDKIEHATGSGYRVDS
jgi:hypothetical protein